MSSGISNISRDSVAPDQSLIKSPSQRRTGWGGKRHGAGRKSKYFQSQKPKFWHSYTIDCDNSVSYTKVQLSHSRETNSEADRLAAMENREFSDDSVRNTEEADVVPGVNKFKRKRRYSPQESIERSLRMLESPPRIIQRLDDGFESYTCKSEFRSDCELIVVQPKEVLCSESETEEMYHKDMNHNDHVVIHRPAPVGPIHDHNNTNSSLSAYSLHNNKTKSLPVISKVKSLRGLPYPHGHNRNSMTEDVSSPLTFSSRERLKHDSPPSMVLPVTDKLSHVAPLSMVVPSRDTHNHSSPPSMVFSSAERLSHNLPPSMTISSRERRAYASPPAPPYSSPEKPSSFVLTENQNSVPKLSASVERLSHGVPPPKTVSSFNGFSSTEEINQKREDTGLLNAKLNSDGWRGIQLRKDIFEKWVDLKEELSIRKHSDLASHLIEYRLRGLKSRSKGYPYRNSLEQSGNMYVFAEVEEEKQKVLKEKAELDEEKGRILQIAQQERIDMLEEKRAFEESQKRRIVKLQEDFDKTMEEMRKRHSEQLNHFENECIHLRSKLREKELESMEHQLKTGVVTVNDVVKQEFGASPNIPDCSIVKKEFDGPLRNEISEILAKHRNEIQQITKERDKEIDQMKQRLSDTEEINKHLTKEINDMLLRHRIELQRVARDKDSEAEELKNRAQQSIKRLIEATQILQGQIIITPAP